MGIGEAGASEQHGAFKPGRDLGGGPVQGGNVLFDGGAFMRRGEGAGDGPDHRPSGGDDPGRAPGGKDRQSGAGGYGK